jgi:hypothetical protein
VDTADRARLIETISVIGRDDVIDGPYGPRSRSSTPTTPRRAARSRFIEDYIRTVVLPLYANTHTESSGTGLQTTRLREEARSIIARLRRCHRDEHAVVFCGSGSTHAVAKLLGVLGLKVPSALDDRHHLTDAIPPTNDRWCSSDRTSTTRTSCRGASRSPTW